MIKLKVNLSKETNEIIKKVKYIHGFKNKSETINHIIEVVGEKLGY